MDGSRIHVKDMLTDEAPTVPTVPTPVLVLAALELMLLLLALRFPGALPEVGFVMVALLALSYLQPILWQRPQLGASQKLKAEGDSAFESHRLAHRNVQSLFMELLLLLLVNVAASLVKFSPGMAEVCSVALIADAVRSLVLQAAAPQATEEKFDVPREEVIPVDHSKRGGAPRPSEAQAPAVPERQPKKLKNLDVNFWADLEEEDDFQQMLAAKVREEVSAPSADAAQKDADTQESKPEPVPKEEDGAGAGGESRKKKGAKAARAKRGKEGKPQTDDSGNQWAARIRQCGKAKDLDGALAAVQEASAAGLSGRQHQEVQNALLHTMIQCGEAAGETAMDLFNQLKADKKADVVTFNIMLRSLLSAGKREEAQSLLKEMNEHGLAANKVTIAELLSDRVRADDAEGIWRIVDWMKNTDFGITNASCSILLKRISNETAAEEVDRSFDLIDQLSEPVDEALCSQAIEAAIRTSRPALANKFMEMLGTLRNKKNGNTSAATFGSMIKLHGQNRDLQQVWSTWNLMREKGVSPSSVTLGCMVEALVNCGAVDDAASLVHQTAADGLGIILNTVIYSSIIKGFAQAKQPEKCFDVLDEMDEQGIPGNTITYNTLLDACAKCGTMSRVPAVFENMRQRHVEPDRITYSTLIKGYCVAGELDCAFKLFDELKADGKLDLDEIVYNSLLDGCGRKQKPQKAMEYLQDMISAGIPPSNYTLSIMVKLLGRCRRLNDALKLASDYQKDFGLKLNVQVFTCLMQACLLNKKVSKAMQIYSDMISELGRLPDRKAHTVLVDGCLQAAAFAEATQVARIAYGLERPDVEVRFRSDGNVGVEFKTMSDLAGKVRAGKMDHKTADLVMEVLDAADPGGKLRSKASSGSADWVEQEQSKADSWNKSGSRSKTWQDSAYTDAQGSWNAKSGSSRRSGRENSGWNAGWESWDGDASQAWKDDAATSRGKGRSRG
ncbi:Rf1 [Symbiodinium natans]|uniref:Rf1 protein n=1 Tax=Symbiodinium natans TaxID=878477 RepID=A0A812V3I7_9DINO|nr:Rf1 [Symbiodinium natans]